MKLATLCYIRQNNQTLMLHRCKKENDIHEGKWNGLGGKFEAHESPEDCVIREVQEESGLLIKSPKLHGFISFPRFKDNEDWYVFVFTAAEFEGQIIDSPEGDLKWIEDDNLLSLNLWEGDHLFLDWIYSGKGFFSATICYENKELQSHSVHFH